MTKGFVVANSKNTLRTNRKLNPRVGAAAACAYQRKRGGGGARLCNLTVFFHFKHLNIITIVNHRSKCYIDREICATSLLIKYRSCIR